MMKKYQFLSFFVLTILFLACGEDKKTLKTDEKKAVDTTKTIAAQTFPIDLQNSRVGWEGSEGLASIKTSHIGSFDLKSGELLVKDNALVGGKFDIDINSMKNFDLKDAKKNEDLLGHLKSADFFDAAKFPTANFELVSAEKLPSDSLKITGNLTLKGIAKSVTFPAKVEMTENGVKADAKFYINRKDWNMTYNSDIKLGDELIRPEVGIELKIVTKP